MAELRDATVGVEKLDTYVDELLPFDLRDVAKACAKIGRAERAEGETAFPTMGKLLVEVKEAARVRGLAELVYVPRPEVRAALERDAQVARMLKAGIDPREPVDIAGLLAETQEVGKP